jgi:hypothetical protein
LLLQRDIVYDGGSSLLFEVLQNSSADFSFLLFEFQNPKKVFRFEWTALGKGIVLGAEDVDGNLFSLGDWVYCESWISRYHKVDEGVIVKNIFAFVKDTSFLGRIQIS